MPDIQPNVLSRIIDFESGNLSFYEIVELFAELIRTGLAWSLQGSYGRTAHSFIEAGIIDRSGTIDWDHESLTQEQDE